MATTTTTTTTTTLDVSHSNSVVNSPVVSTKSSSFGAELSTTEKGKRLSFYAVALPSILVGWILPVVHFFVTKCMVACGCQSLFQLKKNEEATTTTPKTTETKTANSTTATTTNGEESSSVQSQLLSPRPSNSNKPCMACNTPFECKVLDHNNSIITCKTCHEVSCGKCFSNKCARTLNPFEKCNGSVTPAKPKPANSKLQRTSSRKLKELFLRSKK